MREVKVKIHWPSVFIHRARVAKAEYGCQESEQRLLKNSEYCFINRVIVTIDYRAELSVSSTDG